MNLSKLALSIIFTSTLFFSAVVFATSGHNHNHDGKSPITINGSTTVTNFAFFGREEEIEALTGLHFDLYPTSSGRGVLALHNGEADIAMISSEMATIIKKLNTKGHDLSLDNFDVHILHQTNVDFIVQADNPIEEMSLAQIKAAFTGEITQWKDLGVDTLPEIKIATEHETGGIYNTVQYEVLDGAPVTKDGIMMQNGPQAALVVRQLKNGLGFIAKNTPIEQREGTKTLRTPEVDAVATQNLAFVTRKGENRENVLHFIKMLQEHYKN